MEIWKIIDDFPCYEVSNMGRIKSHKGNKDHILKPWNNKRNYLVVRLSCIKGNGSIIVKDIYVHRLVAKYFCCNYKKEYEVHHIDRNTFNNRSDNLLCLSRKDHIALHKHEDMI